MADMTSMATPPGTPGQALLAGADSGATARLPNSFDVDPSASTRLERAKWTEKQAALWIYALYALCSMVCFGALLGCVYFIGDNLPGAEFGDDFSDAKLLDSLEKRGFIPPFASGILSVFLFAMLKLFAPRIMRSAARTHSEDADAILLDMIDQSAARALSREVRTVFLENQEIRTRIVFSARDVIYGCIGHFILLYVISTTLTEMLGRSLLGLRSISSYLVASSSAAAWTTGICTALLKVALPIAAEKLVFAENPLTRGDDTTFICPRLSCASYGSLLKRLLVVNMLAVGVPALVFQSHAMVLLVPMFSSEKPVADSLEHLVIASTIAYVLAFVCDQVVLFVWAWFGRRTQVTEATDARTFILGLPDYMQKTIDKKKEEILVQNPDLKGHTEVLDEMFVYKLSILDPGQVHSQRGFDIGREIDELLFLSLFPIGLAFFNPTLLIAALILVPSAVVLSWCRWRSVAIGGDDVEPLDDVEHGRHRGLQEYLSSDMLQMFGLPAVVFWCAFNMASVDKSLVSSVECVTSIECRTSPWMHVNFVSQFVTYFLSHTLPLKCLIGIVIAIASSNALPRQVAASGDAEDGANVPVGTGTEDTLEAKSRALDVQDRSMYVDALKSIYPLVTLVATAIDRRIDGHMRFPLRVLLGILAVCFVECFSCLLAVSNAFGRDLLEKATFLPARIKFTLPFVLPAVVGMLIIVLAGFLVLGIKPLLDNCKSRAAYPGPAYVHIATYRWSARVVLTKVREKQADRIRALLTDVQRRFPSSNPDAPGRKGAWAVAFFRFMLLILRGIPNANLESYPRLQMFTGQDEYLENSLMAQGKEDPNREKLKEIWLSVFRAACNDAFGAGSGAANAKASPAKAKSVAPTAKASSTEATASLATANSGVAKAQPRTAKAKSVASTATAKASSVIAKASPATTSTGIA
eukprot:TRINITY_DN68745_c0_g1_i1.p1 TRINITY_DN68745_c0_g1~~TRINITY_DN68745_c0_g1_i1.p1  ORF type:complete len:925 (-),score=142.92 TRINITY_DN68745_c0_g1_i1:266-3040(-)